MAPEVMAEIGFQILWQEQGSRDCGRNRVPMNVAGTLLLRYRQEHGFIYCGRNRVSEIVV
jgi:hypothetical protein